MLRLTGQLRTAPCSEEGSLLEQSLKHALALPREEGSTHSLKYVKESTLQPILDSWKV